jgi:nucleoid-associated protein YgaU
MRRLRIGPVSRRRRTRGVRPREVFRPAANNTLVAMHASPVDRDRQLAREAAFAMVAIALSFVVLAAVACWRFGVFTTVNSPPDSPPSFPEATAKPEDVAASDETKRASVLPASGRAAWKSRTDQADFQYSAESPAGRDFAPHVAQAPASVIDPEIADLPSPYEAVAASTAAPRTFHDEPAAQPLPVASTSIDATTPVAEVSPAPRPTSDTPPSPQETDSAVAHRIAAEVRHRRVKPFVEDQRSAARRTPVVEDRPPTRLEAPSAYPPRSAAPTTDSAGDLLSEDSTVVAPDDTFWTISQRVYGSADYYKALYQHNRDRFRRPDRLPIGARVATPPAEELCRLYPRLAPLAAN